MPTYDFRCRSCGDTFEVERPMAASADPAACPHGHSDTVKLLTIGAVARAGRSAGGRAPAPAGGGCCGGGCCG